MHTLSREQILAALQRLDDLVAAADRRVELLVSRLGIMTVQDALQVVLRYYPLGDPR
ncbi:MAG TPA: hypothetical protein VFV75_12470 [Candidatus Polarisedimenticolaceae bacterium]|nr:hypothetical protein [Candidatus Polarisedimenticolaceae bacterium]